MILPSPFRRRPSRRLPVLASVAALLASGAVGADESGPPPDRFADLFRPARTTQAALSPNGDYVAYAVREDDRIAVIVAATARLDQALARVEAVDDRQATPRFGEHRERVPAEIRWMKWTDDERVVLETNAHVATGANASLPGVVMTFTRDGRDGRVLLTARDVTTLVAPPDPAADLSRNTAPLAPTVDDPYFSSGGTEAARAAAREEDPFADGGLFGPAERFELLGGQDGGAGDPATDFGLAPLSPSVFDLDPASSRHVLVRTSGPAFVTLYRLDVTTGAIRQIADYPLDADRLMLSDRQGVPRLAMPGSTNVAFPHRPRLERGPGARLRGELATALGLPAGAFDLAPGNFFAHRALPLAFDEKPGVLYFASNLGRDTYGIYSADLEQGVVTDLALEHPKLDLIPRPPDAFVPAGTLVFDRHSRALVGVRLADLRRTTRWLEPALQAAQTRLEQALPGRNVDILEWDRDRRRLLVFSNGSADPGRFHVFDTESARLSEFAQRAPWLDAGPALRQFRFEVAGPGGHDLAAQLTLPQSPRIMPAPIVVVCPANPWDRLPTDFQAETSALARMGFAVLHYAGRGAWGRGVRHREALHAGYADAQLEDLLAVLDEVGRGFNLDTRRVGLVGSGHGGHLALHALSAHPDRFRCAVALEPPIDLAAWLKRDDWETRDPANQLVRSAFGSAEWLRGRNLADAAGRFVKPSLVLSHPGEDGTWRRSTYLAAQAFARRVASTHPESRFQALSHDFAKGLPLAKAEVYGEIEHFLNTHVYNFGVTIGEAVEVD